MNCANHPDVANVAFCRTCGKSLCANCTRDVRGVIYCENCIAERLQGTPASGPSAAPGIAPGVTPGAAPAAAPSSGPNPAVAGILAGFFPFGVGAVYCGQYAKGLAHLIVCGLLFAGMDSTDGGLQTMMVLGFVFFYIWQIMDAVRTAHAVQAGLPAPDPMGLAQAFGAGEKIDTSKVPTAAIVLIGLGVLLLLQTIGVFEFSMRQFWPIVLILLGGFLFAKRTGVLPSGRFSTDRMRGITGPVFLVTLGIIQLISHMGGPSLHRTWRRRPSRPREPRLRERRLPPGW